MLACPSSWPQKVCSGPSAIGSTNDQRTHDGHEVVSACAALYTPLRSRADRLPLLVGCWARTRTPRCGPRTESRGSFTAHGQRWAVTTIGHCGQPPVAGWVDAPSPHRVTLRSEPSDVLSGPRRVPQRDEPTGQEEVDADRLKDIDASSTKWWNGDHVTVRFSGRRFRLR